MTSKNSMHFKMGNLLSSSPGVYNNIETLDQVVHSDRGSPLKSGRVLLSQNSIPVKNKYTSLAEQNSPMKRGVPMVTEP